MLGIMTLAIINGLITSIILETIILSRQMNLRAAFNTATGMSLISMISMEVAMNTVDVVFAGGVLVWSGDTLYAIGRFHYTTTLQLL
jgi:hypothetical protein